MVVFGIAFLIPLIVLMLNIVGVIKAKQLSKYRTLVIFGTFVFGAVATPSTDPFSMLALAVPMTAAVPGRRGDRPHPRPAQGRGDGAGRRPAASTAQRRARRQGACASCRTTDGPAPA